MRADEGNKVLVFLTGTGCWQDAAAQSYSDALYSDNGMPEFGLWGQYEACPYAASSGNLTFTYALDFKVSRERLWSDGGLLSVPACSTLNGNIHNDNTHNIEQVVWTRLI